MSTASEQVESEFAITPMHGIRAFRVDGEGRLLGFQDHTWEPGENIARCLKKKNHVGFREPGSKASDPRDCTCGFYAYTNEVPTDWAIAGSQTVYGVIEGYGLAAYGDRGYRAQKAKIVALAIPPRLKRPTLPSLRHSLHAGTELRGIGGLMYLTCGILGIDLLRDGVFDTFAQGYSSLLGIPPWVILVLPWTLAIGAILNAVASLLFHHSRDACPVCLTSAAGGTRSPHTLIPQQYPDARIYESNEEMLASFSLPGDPTSPMKDA